MAEKINRTPYEIGMKIKALLNDKADTNMILESVGIKRAQFTKYKKIIKNGRLEELKTKSVRKVLAEEKEFEKSRASREQNEKPETPKENISPSKRSDGPQAQYD